MDVLKKQMPILTQRLNTTLEKLRAPAKADDNSPAASGSLLSWWKQLQIRYTGRHISFSTDITTDLKIPVDIFTTVMENLLDNARNKRIREPDLKIFVSLSTVNDQLQLSVADTGSAIDPQISQQLFKEVVSSQDGFGIGLYQCYELANNHGYKLTVSDASAGNVCFILEPKTSL